MSISVEIYNEIRTAERRGKEYRSAVFVNIKLKCICESFHDR